MQDNWRLKFYVFKDKLEHCNYYSNYITFISDMTERENFGEKGN